MGLVKIAAVGDERPQFSTEWSEAGRNHIVQILVSFDSHRLMSLQFTYLQNNGKKLHTSEIIGSPNHKANNLHVITFKGEGEYVTEVEGLCNNGGSGSIFKRLSIRTNMDFYTIFEAEGEMKLRKKFNFKFGGLNQFGGFHGTHRLTDGEITSVGVYFNHLEALPQNMRVKTEHDSIHSSISN